jgi:hypothetical protein
MKAFVTGAAGFIGSTLVAVGGKLVGAGGGFEGTKVLFD